MLGWNKLLNWVSNFSTVSTSNSYVKSSHFHGLIQLDMLVGKYCTVSKRKKMGGNFLFSEKKVLFFLLHIFEKM